MNALAWHALCELRDDVRAGKLALAEFAVDLNGVNTGEVPAVYRAPAMFFARTFPTFRMRALARDVPRRPTCSAVASKVSKRRIMPLMSN